MTYLSGYIQTVYIKQLFISKHKNNNTQFLYLSRSCCTDLERMYTSLNSYWLCRQCCCLSRLVFKNRQILDYDTSGIYTQCIKQKIISNIINSAIYESDLYELYVYMTILYMRLHLKELFLHFQVQKEFTSQRDSFPVVS